MTGFEDRAREQTPTKIISPRTFQGHGATQSEAEADAVRLADEAGYSEMPDGYVAYETAKGWTFVAQFNVKTGAQDTTKIEIQREQNKPTTCKVWRDGVLIFDGRDYSAGVQVGQEPTEAQVEAAARAFFGGLHPAYRWPDALHLAREALLAAKEADD